MVRECVIYIYQDNERFIVNNVYNCSGILEILLAILNDIKRSTYQPIHS